MKYLIRYLIADTAFGKFEDQMKFLGAGLLNSIKWKFYIEKVFALFRIPRSDSDCPLLANSTQLSAPSFSLLFQSIYPVSLLFLAPHSHFSKHTSSDGRSLDYSVLLSWLYRNLSLCKRKLIQFNLWLLCYWNSFDKFGFFWIIPDFEVSRR